MANNKKELSLYDRFKNFVNRCFGLGEKKTTAQTSKNVVAKKVTPTKTVNRQQVKNLTQSPKTAVKQVQKQTTAQKLPKKQTKSIAKAQKKRVVRRVVKKRTEPKSFFEELSEKATSAIQETTNTVKSTLKENYYSAKNIVDNMTYSVTEEGNEKLKSAKTLMLEVIGRMEGVKMTASANKADGTVDYAFGNHEKADGSKVRVGDKIKSRAELESCFNNFMQKRAFPVMEKCFPLEKMTTEQIVAVSSFIYNCGPGKIYSNGKLTQFGQRMVNALESGDKDKLQDVSKTMSKFVYSKGKKLSGLEKRRNFEVGLFTGEISLTDQNSSRYMDIANSSMGSLTSNVWLSKNYDKCVAVAGKCSSDTLTARINNSCAPLYASVKSKKRSGYQA